MFSLEKRLRGGHIAVYTFFMKGAEGQVLISLRSSDSDRTKGNAMELHQRRVRLSVRKRFLTREWSDTETGSSEQGSWHRAAGVQEASG